MAGLVGYASSDEDEEENQGPHSQALGTPVSLKDVTIATLPAKASEAKDTQISNGRKPDPVRSAVSEKAKTTTLCAKGWTASNISQTHVKGLIGPSRPPATAAYLEQNVDDILEDEEEKSEADEGGTRTTKETDTGLTLPPYSVKRSALRELTMPKAPDFDIPHSPDGREPPPTLEAVRKKLAEFLDMKNKSGIHFNARMSQSSAIKNPAFMDKLLEYAGLLDDGEIDSDVKDKTMISSSVDCGSRFRTQYKNTLPKDIWNQDRFPAWAYRTRLREAHDEMSRKRARAYGERPEFVPSSITSKVLKQ